MLAVQSARGTRWASNFKCVCDACSRTVCLLFEGLSHDIFILNSSRAEGLEYAFGDLYKHRKYILCYLLRGAESLTA